MQFATSDERLAFVGGFALLIAGFVLIVISAATAGIIVAIVGGVILIAAIVHVQRRAPAVRDDSQRPPER
jgi:drug/metabolite transporter superfamily protein YnfA